MSRPPTGTITFLFTDIEGSTRLWEHNPTAMSEAVARHDAILRRVTEEQHNGHVFKTVGDGLLLCLRLRPRSGRRCPRRPEGAG
jgi:class 3 adenylate cyclase